MTKRRFISLVFCLLSLSVLLTIYLAWLFYPWAISQFKLENVVYLSSETIQHNFNRLMTFLTLPWVTQLEMPNFGTSASGLKHFFDVKYLFHGVQGIFLLTLVPAWFSLKRSLKEKSLWQYRKALVFLMILPLTIAILGAVVGFETFFTLFHQVLFPGDSSWLFDPATDPVIWILPAEFFLACFILFFILYQVILGLCLVLAQKQAKALVRKMT